MAAGYRIAAERGHVTAIDAADALTSGASTGSLAASIDFVE